MMMITTRTIVNRYLLFIFVHVSLLFVIFIHNCSAKDNSTTTSTQVITGSQTLISSGQIFKLGFFNPSNSTNRYVGIWYNKFPVQTNVWVANKNNPIKDTSGTLGIADEGNLVISNGRGVVLWTTNISNTANANNTVVELLDTGNLVLSLINDRTRFLWQSFDHPTDTLLPLMQIGASTRQELASWKDESDPSQGIFSAGLEPADGIPQLVLWSNGSKDRHRRSGPWNNIVFIGIPGMTNGYNDGFYLTKDDQDGSMYMSFNYADKTTIRRFVIDHRGVLLGLNWFEGSNEWTQLWSSSQENECEVYGKCGPFGRCNPLNSPICSCLPGFKPMSDIEWNKGNWSGGCVRNTPLRCQNNLNDGFLKLGSVKVPDFASSFWLGSLTIEDCNRTCLRNCSCIAYLYDSGIGCMTWAVKDLVDIQVFDETSPSSFRSCRTNMLGQGGFGQVYKAKLLDGQEIAVKRLSKGSIQGLEEFKNEVLVISKVQHRNLVRLLCCCLEGDEKMLVYEYMPNKSLDAFLFDATKGALLDWKKRFQIIEGISRGILYLHRDSRLRVIHRDLKVSNILLDEDLNPKISDFGMARIFGADICPLSISWKGDFQKSRMFLVSAYCYWRLSVEDRPRVFTIPSSH
ncbi:hypothetical protein C5167_015704 [Papaver somniferum]|uniref:Non-specific serine/threonine protein kinase n=1 Tax=Papaver somniferum TaxID=3469 RepID=A0A4Y7J6T0_PAPSO|nr:hypothetical protein C5167_015704 [Papaver somniferum]